MAYETGRGSQAEDDRYRLLVQSITDYAIYMLDPAGRVVSWNPGAERFKGYGADEILGEHFSRFYTPEERVVGAPERALRIARSEGRYESEGWRVRKDGGRFWAHVVIDPVMSPSGDLAGYAKITRDLTERKQAEETLRQSQEQFRLLVQGVTDYAIYMLDPQGRVSSWNAGAERIKGYREHETLGEHFSKFYTPEDREQGLPQEALRIAASDGTFEREGWRVRKDGSRFWAHVVIDPIRNDQGEVIGFAKITRDISERREAQRALNQTREALLQSQKLDALGQLTGGVAHDFNNLLMAVLGSLELLRRHLPSDNPKAVALLENAMQGAQRGAALTKRMLAFARKQELKLEAVDVQALLRDLTALLRRSVGPSVDIDIDMARDLPWVLTDPHQLETSLLNLAVNARDAMGEGGAIRIEGRRETVGEWAGAGDLAAGDYVVLAVIDQGEGMDPATLARACEPFFTTKGHGKGTGLGLSMVHGLAQQSGGKLSIASEPGVGSRIELWLPATELRPVPDAVETVEAAPEDQRRLRVLAVDDDGLVLMNTAAMLEDMGHQVIAASSANEALAALREAPFDLMVTDFAMPHKTGLQLANEARSFGTDMPVILTSGYAELPPDADCALLRLAKPYTQADLAAAIRTAVPALGVP